MTKEERIAHLRYQKRELVAMYAAAKLIKSRVRDMKETDLNATMIPRLVEIEELMEQASEVLGKAIDYIETVKEARDE